MPRLMLDTDVLIDAMRGTAPAVRRRLQATRPDQVVVSSIVAAELWTGVMKSRERFRNQQVLNDYLSFVQVLDWPTEAAPIYAEIRTRLERSGQLIGAMDMLIAAHAMHERATLVTRNRADFMRVAGLKLETW